MMTKSYGMYTDYGNSVVENILSEVLMLPISSTNEDIYGKLTLLMNKAATDHRTNEIWDTEVREHIIHEIEKATDRDLTIYF